MTEAANATDSVVIYIEDERHTLASALRPVLESQNPEDFVACTLVHPLDAHLRIEAPSVSAIREALLSAKGLVERARTALSQQPHLAS